MIGFIFITFSFSFFVSMFSFFFFFSSRRRHTRWTGDWSSDVCSSDLEKRGELGPLVRLDTPAQRERGAGREAGLQSRAGPARHRLGGDRLPRPRRGAGDRKSTRLNSSHPSISYAVFCLKKKKQQTQQI